MTSRIVRDGCHKRRRLRVDALNSGNRNRYPAMWSGDLSKRVQPTSAIVSEWIRLVLKELAEVMGLAGVDPSIIIQPAMCRSNM